MWYSRGRTCVCALTLTIAGFAPAARAMELEWQAPAGCPTTEAVKRDVRRLAGSAEGASLVAHAAVTQTTDQRWRVAIDLSGAASGHRTLTADTCVQLARASALIIALAANPEAALDLSSDEPVPAQPSPEPNAAESGSPAATTTASPVPSNSRSEVLDASRGAPRPHPTDTPRDNSADELEDSPAESADESVLGHTPHVESAWSLFAHSGLERGSLPTSTAWLGFGTRYHARAMPLGFVASGLVTQGTSARFENGVGADFRFFAGNAQACLQPHARRWLLAACLGAQVAMTRSQGRFQAVTAADPRVAGGEIFTRYRWSAAPIVTMLLGYELVPHLSLELGASLAVPARRWEYWVEGVGPLYRTSRQQVLVHAGVSLSL